MVWIFFWVWSGLWFFGAIYFSWIGCKAIAESVLTRREKGFTSLFLEKPLLTMENCHTFTKKTAKRSLLNKLKFEKITKQIFFHPPLSPKIKKIVFHHQSPMFPRSKRVFPHHMFRKKKTKITLFPFFKFFICDFLILHFHITRFLKRIKWGDVH